MAASLCVRGHDTATASPSASALVLSGTPSVVFDPVSVGMTTPLGKRLLPPEVADGASTGRDVGTWKPAWGMYIPDENRL